MRRNIWLHILHAVVEYLLTIMRKSKRWLRISDFEKSSVQLIAFCEQAFCGGRIYTFMDLSSLSLSRFIYKYFLDTIDIFWNQEKIRKILKTR